MALFQRTFNYLLNSSSTTAHSTAKNLLGNLRNGGKVKHMFSATCLTMVNAQARMISTQEITKNIQYITDEKHLNLDKDPDTLKLKKPIDKPLCIMLNWLLAKQKHIFKYSSIYLEQGFDVLSVSCTPWQFLWPMKGSQLVAADLLKFMEQNTSFNPLVLHGFSVGGYLWGEVLMMISRDMNKYEPLLNRITAQTWDSAADISELSIGVPRSVFPKNEVLRNAFRKYILYHMKTFHQVATVHYMRSSQQFHRNLCKAPALFLLSKSDAIGSENSNRRVHDSWESLGIKTTWKCWDKSPHVQHFTKHPKEYMAALNAHLSSVGLVSQPEKMKLRL